MSEPAEPPIACTLQGAGYRERLALIEELARDGLHAVTRDDLNDQVHDESDGRLSLDPAGDG